MISLLSPERESAFLRACNYDPLFGARIQTIWRVYGNDARSALFWIAEDFIGRVSAAICRFDGWLVISADESLDLEELSAFAAAVGGFRYVESSPLVCRYLHRGIPGEYSESLTMRYVGNGVAAAPEVCSAPPIADVYNVICSGSRFMMETTRWESWYPYVSHLVRHGLGFCCALYDGGKVVSTGGVYTMGEEYAVISSLATLPQYRGKGYAADILRYLVGRILELGKTPALFIASDTLAVYYEKHGFVRFGRWGQIECATDGKTDDA